MFDLTSIGAATHVVDAGATASLRGDESTDAASSSQSFVEALRSLASVSEPENAPASTWLSPGGPVATVDEADARSGEVPPVAAAPDEDAASAIGLAVPAAADVPLPPQWAAALPTTPETGGWSVDVDDSALGGANPSPADSDARVEDPAPARAGLRTMPGSARRPAHELPEFRRADDVTIAGAAIVSDEGAGEGAPAPVDTAGATASGLAEAAPAEDRKSDDPFAPSASREPATPDLVAAAVTDGSDGGRDDHGRPSAREREDASAPAVSPRRPQHASGIPTGMSAATVINGTYAHAWRVALAQADAAASPTPEAVPSNATAQIVQAIRLQWTKGVGEAHIRLDPAQYGDLTVSLRVDDGQVVARVQSDTAVIRDWLQGHQGWLRQSLADQGLTLSRLEVHEPASETRDQREPGGQGSAARDEDQPPSRRPRRSSNDGVFEVVA